MKADEHNSEELLYRAREQFVCSSETAVLEVKHDQGVYRHLHVKLEHTWFDIVTAPGVLFYTGDMGDFTFRRLEDMFQFFRQPVFAGRPAVKPEYWAQKLVAVDKTDGYEEFKRPLFVRELNAMLKDPDGNGISPEEVKELKSIEEMTSLPGTREEAISWLYSVVPDIEPYANLGVRYTARYLWCICAIVWAINAYDKTKKD